MKIINKNILLISPEPWGYLFVSKHHYTTHLSARGNKVFFLNPPQNKISVEDTIFDNVWSVNYSGFVRGIRFYPAFLQKWLLLRKFNQLQQICKVKFDIVWSFDNSVFYDFDALSKSILKISHIVDLNQNFQTEKAAQTADICLGVTHKIVDRLKNHNSFSHFINHGFNLNNDNDCIKLDLPEPGKLKAIYAGNLAMKYLDWEPLLQIAKENPSIDFIFIGPNAQNFSLTQNITHQFKGRCYQLSNTFFEGKINANDLNKRYKSADILLISYQEKYHLDQSNPHKMMEYLGSGKVVVATQTTEYYSLTTEGIIAMATKNKEYAMLFNEVVNKLTHWNSTEFQQKRRNFALNNTYAKQVERIENLLEDLA